MISSSDEGDAETCSSNTSERRMRFAEGEKDMVGPEGSVGI